MKRTINPVFTFKSTLKHGIYLRKPIKIENMVELVDLFPSLADLAGLAVPTICPFDPVQPNLCTEGVSFKQLLSDKILINDDKQNFSVGNHNGCNDAEVNCQQNRSKMDENSRHTIRWKRASFSQYPRPSNVPTANSDQPKLETINIMGYTIKKPNIRYTEWVYFDHKSFTRNWTHLYGQELYINDEDEINNLANITQFQDVVKILSEELHRGWRDALPK